MPTVFNCPLKRGNSRECGKVNREVVCHDRNGDVDPSYSQVAGLSNGPDCRQGEKVTHEVARMSGSHELREAELAPVHPGEVLDKEFLRPLGITQYQIAKAIGVDVRRIHASVRSRPRRRCCCPASFKTPLNSGWGCRVSMSLSRQLIDSMPYTATVQFRRSTRYLSPSNSSPCRTTTKGSLWS